MNRLLVNISRAFIVLVSRFPLRVHYCWAGIWAWMMKKVFRYRYSIVHTNVARSFPDKSYGQVQKIVDDFYKHLGEVIAETIWFAGSGYKRVRRSGIVKVTNPEVLEKYFVECPSLTVLSTHCGNWELLGGIFAYMDNTGIDYSFDKDNMRVVYKKLKSPVSNEIFKRNRINPIGKDGEKCVIESSQILRYAVAHRKERKVYVYPTDQAPYWKAGKHFIGNFMNQPTDTMQGSVGVACRLSHGVLYVKMKRVRRGQYDLTLIPICEDASGMTQEELMRKYYDLLEEEIRETPANWLWSHKRWK